MMMIKMKKFLFGMCLSSQVVGAFVNANIQQAIYSNQYSALSSFYNATGAQVANHSEKAKVVGGDEYCQDDGIICDSNGFVVSIDLREQGLNGTIPSEIASLVHLRALRLNDNELFGQLPTALLEMTGLRYLNLGKNFFDGAFPELTGMTALRRLMLGRNSFSGTIPNSICDVQDLEALDLSSCTKLHGTLPSCLEDLTAMKFLKITDIGLSGTVPSGLCDGRAMNGFDPNPFGCAAIGCEAGYYHREGGRQTEKGSPCKTCKVPSNALSSSSCQWIPQGRDGVASLGPSVTQTIQTAQPTFAPSAVPSHFWKGPPMEKAKPTWAPSIIPSYFWKGSAIQTPHPGSAPSGASSQYPTNQQKTAETPQLQPTMVPTLRTMQSSQLSDKPTVLSILTAEKTVAVGTMPPTTTTTEEPTANVFLDASEAHTAPSAGGLIGGSATAGACVLIFLLFILSRQGPPKYFVRADNEEDTERFVEEPTRGAVRIRVEPQTLPSLRSPQASLSTIEEEDSAAVSRSDSLETVPRPSPCVGPPSPPNLRADRSVKKVRFALPTDLEMDWRDPFDTTDMETVRDPANNFGNVDRWATWIMNPFDTHNFCGAPTPTATTIPLAEDERSWHSIDAAASANSDMPILDQKADSNTSSSTTIVSNMRVLGISSRTRDDAGVVTLTESNRRPARTTLTPRPRPKAAASTPTSRKGTTTNSRRKPHAKQAAPSQDSRHVWRRKGMAEI